VRLLPAPPRPIRIQRWTIRRVALWAGLLLLLLVGIGSAKSVYDDFSGGRATRTSLNIDSLRCDDFEPLWLQAQAVPSATLVPCLDALPAGWTVANVAVDNGRSVLTLNHDQAGNDAVEVQLTATCNPGPTVEVPTEQPGVRRYQRIENTREAYSAVWYDQYAGGCVTTLLHSTTDLEGGFAKEMPQMLISRQTLENALQERSDGRLHLNPDPES
jgi:hypothetical protein